MIALSVDGEAVAGDVAKILRDLERFDSEVNRIGLNVERAFKGVEAPDLSTPAGGGGGSSAGGSSATKSAEEIGAAMSRSLTPLLGFAARFEKSFDRVGGAIITSARRADAAMKFPAFDKALETIEGKITNSFGKGAVGAIRKLARVRDFLGSMGDVAGKGLGKLGIGGGAGGLGGVLTTVSGIGPATAVAGKGFSAMSGMILGAVGATTALGGATAFLVKGVQQAAALNETLSKTGQVFGPSAKDVIGNADAMAKSFGLPKGEILDGASAIGLLGKAAGQNEAQAAGMANAMVKLAADASSFHNIPLDEALGKIRSGLAGESEPLRSMGILLSEDAVALEAVRLGLSKTGKDLDETAKVTARASLITKGMADAQGDLERTSGSTANQFRKFSGNISNLATDIGAKLMPAVDTGLALLNEFGTYLGELFQNNQGMFDGFVAGIQEAFNTVGVVFRNFGDVWEIARLTAAQAIGNLLAVFRSIGPNVVQIAEYIGRNWSGLIVDGINLGATALQNFAKNLMNLGKSFIKWIKNPTKGMTFDWTPLAKGFEATVETLPDLIKPEFVSMQTEIDAAAKRMADKEAARASAMKKAPGPQAAKKMEEPKVDKKALDERRKLEEKLATDAKKRIEDVRTPLEKYRHELDQLDKMKGAGLIDSEVHRRGGKIAKEEFEKENTAKRAGALDVDSKEARSLILAHQGRTADDPAKTTAQATKQIAASQAAAVGFLQTIAAKITGTANKVVDAGADALNSLVF